MQSSPLYTSTPWQYYAAYSEFIYFLWFMSAPNCQWNELRCFSPRESWNKDGQRKKRMAYKEAVTGWWEAEWALPGLITEHIISVDGNWTCVKENTTVQVEEKMERIPDCGAECRLVCWWGTITGRGEGQHERTIRRWRAGCFNSSSFGFVTTDCGGIYSAAVSLRLRLVSLHFTEITCQPVKRKRPIQHWEIWHFIKGAHALMELFSQVNFTYEVQI